MVGLGAKGRSVTQARRALSRPAVVTADALGNVVADTGDNQVDVVATWAGACYGRQMTPGRIYIIAGNGTPGLSGDGRG